MESSVQNYILEESAAAVAAACGHQLALMRLAVANLQTGKTLPQTLIGAMCASTSGGGSSSPHGKAGSISAETVVNAVFDTLMPSEQEELRRLSVLPTSFVAPAAAKVTTFSHQEYCPYSKQQSLREVSHGNLGSQGPQSLCTGLHFSKVITAGLVLTT